MDNELRNEFTDALWDATLDFQRDKVVYIDPKSQSDLTIATKIRTAMELTEDTIIVRKTRYPAEADYAIPLPEK